MKNRAIWLITLVVIGFGLSPARAGVTILSSNLDPTDHPTDGTSSISNSILGNIWIASSFGTDANSYLLKLVTLRMDMTTAGAAQLEIYTDIPQAPVSGQLGTMPGSSLGTLTSPPVIGTALGDYTFTSGGLSLAPNSTYWVVLKALSGAFDWAYAAENDITGKGVGFQHTWGGTEDTGTTWYTYDAFPMIMEVTAIPEPSTLALFGTAVLLFGMAIGGNPEMSYKFSGMLTRSVPDDSG